MSNKYALGWLGRWSAERVLRTVMGNRDGCACATPHAPDLDYPAAGLRAPRLQPCVADCARRVAPSLQNGIRLDIGRQQTAVTVQGDRLLLLAACTVKLLTHEASASYGLIAHLELVVKRRQLLPSAPRGGRGGPCVKAWSVSSVSERIPRAVGQNNRISC